MAGTQNYQNLPVLWTFVGLVFIFAGLRLYTRLSVVKQFGWDDHIYLAASFFLAAYAAILQLAAIVASTSQSDDTRPRGWEMLALTTIFVGTAVAKCSLGVFLLRFILSKWQRVVIWALMATVLVFATGAATALWINCLSWSTANLFHAGTLPHCSPLINFTLFLKFYGVSTVTVDMSLAIVPWFSLYSLNMPQMEKRIIGASLSLGFIAAICGIVRNIVITKDEGLHYLDYDGPFTIWSGAEVFVTLLCNVIPVLRPLVFQWFPRLRSMAKPSFHASPPGDCELGNCTIGGGMMFGPARGGQQLPRAPRKAHLAMTGERTSSQSDEDELVSRISLDDLHREDDLQVERYRGAEHDLEERGSGIWLKGKDEIS